MTHLPPPMGEVTERKPGRRGYTLSVSPVGCQLSRRESQVVIITIHKEVILWTRSM